MLISLPCLDFANHASIRASKVVLALGHFASELLAALKSLPADKVITPWDAAQFHKIPLALPIAILGTGHTAIDALLRLRANTAMQKSIFNLPAWAFAKQPSSSCKYHSCRVSRLVKKRSGYCAKLHQRIARAD